jgi:hypothetical protein
MIAWILHNPFITLCVPPTVMVLQFLDFVLIQKLGLPKLMADAHGPVAICILLLFALNLITIPAAMLAVRQVFLLPNKIAPSLGILFNGGYLVAFIAFFILCFVTQSFS